MNEMLHELQEKCLRKRKVDAMLHDLEPQLYDLRDQVDRLLIARADEQADVDRFQGGSLTALFYTVIGKKEEKLDKEKAEAHAAAVRYESAKAQLGALQTDVDRLRRERDSLKAAEPDFLAALEAAQAASDDPEIAALQQSLGETRAQIKEIRESVYAGQDVSRQLESIQSQLDDAESWGTWDLVGGGLISTAMKHSSLNEAQREIEQLQICLRRFHTELSDIKLTADVTVKTDSFLTFADYFFDGIFADWAVMDHIRSSKGEMDKIKMQLQQVLWKLEDMENRAHIQECDLQQRIADRLIQQS